MIQTFATFIQLAWVILYKNKHATTRLFEELNTILKPHGKTLSDEQKKRIWFYTAQSAITNHWFSLLRGYPPNKQERENGLYLGAFTPVADDLMDKNNIKFEELGDLETDTSDAILYHFFKDKLNPIIEKNAHFRIYFFRAHKAQNNSLKQLDSSKLSNEELKQISFDKGGYYTTLYRMILENDPLEGEEDAIYTLGSILQLLNDLFDMHKDFHNGVQTLVTSNPDIHFLRSIIQTLESRFKQQFQNLDYAKNARKRSLASILAIVTRGHVALDYYQKLQGSAELIHIGSYDRKSLIVDMELISNIWLNLKATHRAIKSN